MIDPKYRVSILFVCLGNICRSPSAHGVFQKMVDEAGLSDLIYVDSAGTGDWHIGRSPDDRTQKHALARGYDLSGLRARQVGKVDFEQFDYILPMDKQNMLDMRPYYDASSKAQLSLFLDFLDEGLGMEVPDPYYEGEEGFEIVLDMVEKTSKNLLIYLQESELD